MKSIRAYFGRDGHPSVTSLINKRINVYWTGDKQHFAGTVVDTATENGAPIHQVKYDDGALLWHDLQDEQWTILDAADTRSSAQIALSTIAHDRVAHSAHQRAVRTRVLAQRDLAVIAFTCIYADDLCDQADMNS